MKTTSSFEIVRVICPRSVERKTEYLVEWRDIEERTWEPAAAIVYLPAFRQYAYRQKLYLEKHCNEAFDSPYICGHVKLDSGELRFLANWNRFGYRTWEPRSSFRNVNEFEQYLRGLGNLI